jgi:hypothetical protein
MSERSYRLTVLVSALVWFLLGLHSPVHQLTHHRRDTTVLVVIAVLAILGIVCVVALWRAPRFGGEAGAHE